MNDKCGQKLDVGDVVDIFVSDMVKAVVAEIREGGLVGPNGQPEPAQLMVTIPIPIKLDPGAPAPVYILRKAVKEEAPRDESKVEKKGPRRVN